MRRFRFTLEVLLQLRRRKEDEVKRALAAKNSQIAEANRELRRLYDTLNDLQNTQRQRRSGTVNIIELRYSVAYRYSLKNDILKQGRAIDELKAQAEGIRKDLVKARQKTRAVELLKERRHSEWKKEYASQEQGRTDEISQQRYARTARPTAQAA